MNERQHNQTPRVSVAVPVYNAERYLDEAMGSVLGQTFDDFEIVVVNDGSTDRSGAMLDAYAERDPRVRVLHQANAGLVGALNAAIDACRGAIVIRFDSDDVCEADRFVKQVEYLDAHSDVVAVGSWMQAIDPDGGELNRFEYPADHEAIEALFLSGHNAIGHPAAAIRRDALVRIGGYRLRPHVEDLDLFLRLAEVGRLANLPEPLLRYRQHPASVCATHRGDQIMAALDVINHARERRGMSPLSELPKSSKVIEQAADRSRRFALHAIRRGDLPAARRYALDALRREPLRLSNWRTAWWSLTG